MQDITKELHDGLEARMRVIKNELIFLKNDMQRIENEMSTVENCYTKSFNRVAQEISTHIISSYEGTRKKAQEDFENFKNAFFTDIEGYLPSLENNLKKIEEVFNEINEIIAQGYNNNEMIEDTTELVAITKGIIENTKRSIIRSKNTIEKFTL